MGRQLLRGWNGYRLERVMVRESSTPGAGDGNRTRVNSLEGCRTTIVLHPPGGRLVARTGFEPVISGLKGRRPSPLDERAAPGPHSIGQALWRLVRRPGSSEHGDETQASSLPPERITLWHLPDKAAH